MTRGPYKQPGVARTRTPVSANARGKRVWKARYVDLDGKVRQAGTFATKSQAKLRSEAAVRELNDSGRPVTGGGTVVALCERWPYADRLDRRTLSTRQERVRYCLPHLPREGQLEISELNRAHVLEVQDALLRRGLAKDMVDKAISALRLLHSDCRELGLCSGDPAGGVRVRRNDQRHHPTSDRRAPRAVDAEELREFLACLPERWRDRTALCVAVGVRPGEWFALRQGDLDVVAGVVRVRRTCDRYGRERAGTKTTYGRRLPHERCREVPCPTWLLARLAGSVAPTPADVDPDPAELGELLVPNGSGRPWCSRNFLRDVWHPARRLAGARGVDPFTVKDLRHTYATLLTEEGVPQVSVSAWMGHKLPRGPLGASAGSITTDVYVHAGQRNRAEAVAVVERFLAAIGIADSTTTPAPEATMFMARHEPLPPWPSSSLAASHGQTVLS